MNPLNFGRTYLGEVRFGFVALSHVSSLNGIRQTLESVESGETYFHDALTKKFSSDMKKSGISVQELRRDLDAVFERAETVSNGAVVRSRRKIANIHSYRISSVGHLHVCESADGTLCEIAMTPFMTKSESEATAKQLSKIGAKYGLRLVDWTRSEVVDISEEERAIEYFKKVSQEDPVPEGAAALKKSQAGYYVAMACMGLFIASIARSIVVSPEKLGGNGWLVLAFWGGLSIIVIAVVRLNLQKVTDEGLKMSRFPKGSVVPYGDMRYVTSRYDAVYHIFLMKNGKLKKKKLDKGMLEGSWDSFTKIMEGMRKTRIEKQKGPNPDVAKPTVQEFSEAFKSTCLKNDQILFRDFVLNLFGKLSAKKKFLKVRYEACGFYFDGARHADWDFSEVNRKSKSSVPDYSPLAGEKLEHLGDARGGTFEVHLGASGKLYASRGSRLYLYGTGHEDGLYRLLMDEDPLETMDFLEGQTDPFGICCQQWYECDIHDGLAALRRKLQGFGEAFQKGAAIPILERDDGEEYLVFDTVGRAFYGIGSDNEDREMRATLLENRDELTSYLENRGFRSKLLCPAKYRDQYLREIGEASGKAMDENDWQALRDAERTGGVFESSENKGGGKVATAEGNPDWKPAWSFFKENRSRRVFECIMKWKEKFETEFPVAYENFYAYMDEYAGSFGNPKARLTPLADHLGERASEPTGEYSQFSFIIKNSVGHEAAFDVCSVMGIKVNPNYLAKALENDGLPGIHSMAIFPNRETGEFVVLDCQNVSDNYCLTARVDGWQSDAVRRRMTEWENYLRSERGHFVECESLHDEIDDPESPLYQKMSDYGITEKDFLEIDSESQFAYRGSLKHEIDRFRWKWRI